MNANQFPQAPAGSYTPNAEVSDAFINQHFPGALSGLDELGEDRASCVLVITEEGVLCEDNSPLYWNGEGWDDLGPTG